MAFQTYVILHDIRSIHNVGSIFRTADGAGVTKIFLTGYTPSPKDRFGRIRKDLQKVALGAEASVPWEEVCDIHTLFERLQNEGVRIVAVEQDARSIPYTAFKQEGSVAYVFGNEPDGLPKEVLEMSDVVLEIPMYGKKESLNVSVAVGIILFRAI